MEYTTIKLPIDRKFRELDRSAAQSYFQWFIHQLPIRIKILERAVQSTNPHEPWEANFTPESLSLLGQWFSNVVDTRPRSEKDREGLMANAPSWFGSVIILDWDLTERSFSFAVDVGMYFSKTIEVNVENAHWILDTKMKSSVDYQQPVLVGAGIVPLNPVRIAVTYAYGLAKKSLAAERLGELYEIWSNMLRDN